VGHRRARRYLFALLLVWRLAAAGQERGEIEALSIDARNAAQGGGAVLTSFSHFCENPAFSALDKKFYVGSSYFFLESFSFAVSDSKTGAFAGGLMYDRHGRLDTIKTNTAFRLGDYFFLGFNLKFLSGPYFPLQRKVQAFTAEVGLAAQIKDRLYFGATFSDFVPLGDNLPMRIAGQFSWDIYKRMFIFNFSGGYHIDFREERVPDRRSFVPHADFATGLEFRYSWFSAQVGVNTSSFARDFTFNDLLKTVGVGFYKERTVKVKKLVQDESGKPVEKEVAEEKEEDGGGVYAGLFITRTFISFGVTFIWEPK